MVLCRFAPIPKICNWCGSTCWKTPSASTVTLVVVFLPLISITGVTRTFFRALTVTMVIMLFTSLALALTWTPELSHCFIKKLAKCNILHIRPPPPGF